MSFNSTFSMATTLAEQTARATESAIMAQLNDFISRDLIEIQVGPLSFLQNQHSNTVDVKRTVKLVLKDKEYIEKLEKENSNLRNIISELKLLTK